MRTLPSHLNSQIIHAAAVRGVAYGSEVHRHLLCIRVPATMQKDKQGASRTLKSKFETELMTELNWLGICDL